MTPWQVWQRVVELYGTNRRLAAKTIYKTLPKDFRIRLVKFAFWVSETGTEVKRECLFYTPYGEFRLTKESVRDLVDIIPEVEDGNYE